MAAAHLPAILNFGSLNIDHLYRLQHSVRPGETLACSTYQRLCGGKGLNQSVAAARAGARVLHAGCVGGEGAFLIEALQACDVDTRLVRTVDEPTGHAIIQLDASGENKIIIFGGANRCITAEHIETALQGTRPGDWLLLQNETNAVEAIIAAAAERKLHIVLNPAPYTAAVNSWPLELVDLLLVNRLEGAELSGQQQVERITAALHRQLPHAELVLTLGADGVRYHPGRRAGDSTADSGNWLAVRPPAVTAVDTTAAGDTFVGYFLASRAAGMTRAAALERASRAAALAVTRVGAMQSIPTLAELAQFVA